MPRPFTPIMLRIMAMLTITPDAPDACWLTRCYLGGSNHDRPKIGTGGKHGGNRYAAQVVLEASLGRTLSGNEQALHSCDNPACLRPAHLFLGTQADNMADRRTKGREACGERHGHAKLTDTQVAEVVDLRSQGWLQQDIADAYGISQASVSNWSRRGRRDYCKAHA